MADAYSVPRLDGVREVIREPLSFLVQHLRGTLGDNLKSITVVGSSLTDDFQPATSDINTVVLLDKHDIPVLNAIASLAGSLHRHRLSLPLLMTPPISGRDVFGVEFLDFN
jgi:hypothetical protein